MYFLAKKLVKSQLRSHQYSKNVEYLNIKMFEYYFNIIQMSVSNIEIFVSSACSPVLIFFLVLWINYTNY